MELLDPKNDFVFKTLFLMAPELLPALINAVRSEEKPVEIVEILNPRIDPEELAGKFIVLDILAKDPDGQQYNIEIQVRRYPAWSARSLYYLARMLGNQLNSGHDYTLIKPVVGIHLLDFELFTAEEHQTQALWRFEMRDERQPKVRLGRELQLNLIELPKADRLGLSLESLSAWVTFFEHWQEENTMSDIHYPPVQKALDCIKSLSADAETRRLAFVRERALGDEAALLRHEREAGRQEGKAEGRAEGKAEGRAEGKAEGRAEGKLEGLEEAVSRLVQSGMSEDQARRLLGHESGLISGEYAGN